MSWGNLPTESAVGVETDWLDVASLRVVSGKIWIGDPQFAWAEANEGEGCVVELPAGNYTVEAKGIAFGRPRFLRGSRFVSRVRVRQEGTQLLTAGDVVGEAETDSGQIGIADPTALKSSFDAVCGDDVDRALDMLEKGINARIGIFEPDRRSDGRIVYLPSGFGDGGGPVVRLQHGHECVGLEHEFIPSGQRFS
jgi:hypothetical protein